MAARLVAIGIILLALGACGDSQRPPTAPTSTTTPPVAAFTTLTVTGDRERILSTESIQLTARATLADGTTAAPKAIWVVDKPAVATVNDRGLVTGVSAGNVLVVAALQGMTASFPLRVDPDFRGVWSGTAVLIDARCNDFRRCGFGNPPPAIKVTITQSASTATATLEQRDSRAELSGSVSSDGLLMLSGRFRALGNTVVEGSDVLSWRTRIDQTGKLTGEYTLAFLQEFFPFINVYRLQDMTRAATSPPPAATTPGPPSAAALRYLTLSPDLSTLLIGRNQTLAANGIFNDGSTRSVAASWIVDNPQVASITDQGVITAKKLGAVTVTASASGFSVSRRLTTLNDFAGWWEGNAVVRSCTSRLADSCKGVTAGQGVLVYLFVDQQDQRSHGLVNFYLGPGEHQMWADGTVADDGTMTMAGEYKVTYSVGSVIRRVNNWKSLIRDDGTMTGTFSALSDENYSVDATRQINLDITSMRHTRVVPNRVR